MTLFIFIVGFEHERREKNGRWKFTRWNLVDLSHFKVKLKAEFQGSNYDMYRAHAIVASGKDDWPVRLRSGRLSPGLRVGVAH